MTLPPNPCQDDEVALLRCDICGRDEAKAIPHSLAPDFGWIRRIACGPCGERHSVCLACFSRWRLGPWVEAFDLAIVGPDRAGARLEVCPKSDEFRVAIALGEG